MNPFTNLRLTLLAPVSALAILACGSDTTEPPPQTGGPVTCEGDVCTVSGTLTTDLTMTADKQWLIRGGVFVGDDETRTVLTVEPGTTVYGEPATNGMLVITRGSQLIADGTKDAPIVFTSPKDPGSRARADWGGLIINGRAPVNGCDAAPCESFGEGGTGFYGGSDPSDNSGILRYVRVEFAGRLISPDNELNGIAFQGVGNGTTVDYVQVHMNKDDGVEFFGGTVDVKHVVLTGIGDDSMDWTDGWSGRAQFVIAQQYEDSSDNGIEADNNGELNDAMPRSSPTLSNITFIGSPAAPEGSDVGMLLREGTAATIANAIVTSFNEACLDIDGDATFAQASSNALSVNHSIVNCTTNFDDEDGDPMLVSDFFNTLNDGNMVGDPMLVSPTDQLSPDFRVQMASPAMGMQMIPSDAFFEQVGFIGAVGPTEDWTEGWTTSAAN